MIYTPHQILIRVTITRRWAGHAERIRERSVCTVLVGKSEENEL